MRALFTGAALIALVLPALAQQMIPGGPGITIQAPCVSAPTAALALKASGYSRVVTGRDVDGDPFAIYRDAEGRWRALAFVPQDNGMMVCSLLTGDEFKVEAGPAPGKGS